MTTTTTEKSCDVPASIKDLTTPAVPKTKSNVKIFLVVRRNSAGN